MNNNSEFNGEWYINTLVMPDSIIMRVDSGSPAHLKNRSGPKVPSRKTHLRSKYMKSLKVCFVVLTNHVAK